MNTNQLKRFSAETRQKLLRLVRNQLEQVLNTDSIDSRENEKAITELQQQIVLYGKEQVIEKVAYTWFNRLVAFRFMDSNGYTDVGVISPPEGDTLPEILQEAKQGNVDEDLQLDRPQLWKLLDGKVAATKPQNEAYRLLLVAECNRWHEVMPFMFQPIDDYTELLMPQDLLSRYSIITAIREGIAREDCQNEEIMGWLYQFYIAEKKDEVFASKGKVKKEDIPAATQLFTPRWIVEYMVQNTLGKLWLQSQSSSDLKEEMPYYIESASEEVDPLKVDSPEDIRLLDQACGSGHILVYAFDLLTKIYEEQGYTASEISRLIVEKNLHGFEIDERAAQLANFTLLMKARAYYRRLFRRGKTPTPNILCYRDLRMEVEEIAAVFKELEVALDKGLLADLNNMRQATNLGSLIVPTASAYAIQQARRQLEYSDTEDLFVKEQANLLVESLKQLERIAQRFHCVVDNPPYMGGGNMNKDLATFVKKNYPDSKADLMACFMESGLKMLWSKGYLGMINLPSWLFLSSFEKLRKKLIKNNHITSLLHMGRGIFGVDWGSTAFTITKEQKELLGHYFRLHKRNFQHIYPEDIRDIFLKAKNDPRIKINFDIYREGEVIKKVNELIDTNGLQISYTANQKNFEKIPGSPIGYWVKEKILKIFNSKYQLSNFGSIGKGLDTGNNLRFLRFWSEVPKKNKWKPCQKGGIFRKWYGNNEYLIDWEKEGSIIKNFAKSNLRNSSNYFKPGVTWARISSGQPSFRYFEEGYIFESTGPCAFFQEEDRLWVLGFLNSKVVKNLLKTYSPTLDFQSGHISKLPYVKPLSKNIFEKIVIACLQISRQEWNSHETSWDFQQNELLRLKSGTLAQTYNNYCHYWREQFHQLHQNEEELNRQFIDIYGLQEELTPDVPLEDITILKQETEIVNGKLVFDAGEVMRQFISYAVGCMMGRYSLEKKGLILANVGEGVQEYWEKVGKDEGDERDEGDEKDEGDEGRFEPDDDGIIPVLEGDYFVDDVVERFRKFLKLTFGEADFDKNLRFVEKSLGKSLRKYFMKDFYKDHLKRYKKRPIYWLFSSPNKHFNALVYVHRYRTDTVSKMLNDYLREFIRKVEAERQSLIKTNLEAENLNSRLKTLNQRQITHFDKVLADLRNYEKETLLPLARRQIPIDLDDGVLVNYNKMGQAVYKVTSLNDAKARKKVQGFDWVTMREGLE